MFPSLELAGGEDPEGMVRQEHSVHCTQQALHTCSSHSKGTMSRDRINLREKKGLSDFCKIFFDTAFKNGCTIRLAKYLFMKKPLDTENKNCCIDVEKFLVSSFCRILNKIQYSFDIRQFM